MNAYQPLNCDLHDFLEIACMRSYLLELELVDGQRLVARALTTRTSATKEEFLAVEQNGTERQIRLDQLAAMTPSNASAEFGRIVFTEVSCQF